MYLSRNEIISEAIYKCYKEMYKMAQPSVDFDQIIEDIKSGKIKSDEPVYEHYYLSSDNYTYIINMYLNAYGLVSEWDDDINAVINYLKDGGLYDVYVKGTDDKPGYKDYEHTPKISDVIGKDNADIVLDLISKCKNFYIRNGDENTFRINVMNSSPTSNKQTVIDYWKSQGKDIEIKDFDIENVYFKEDD